MADLSEPAVEIPISDPASVTDPTGDRKDICRRITNTEAKYKLLDVPEESIHNVDAVSSPGLNNAAEDDQPTCDENALTGTNLKHDHSEADACLKKPDKILQCPRCKSSNTKFCYYNNHNVNQPRHFCKNCQRYWTAGGTMRNVPVGAGRRKTKHSLLQQSDSEAVFASVRHLIGNNVVIEQGPKTPSCKPVTSVLNLGGQEKNAKTVFGSGEENVKELSGLSSATPNCAESDLSKFAVHKEQTGSPGCCRGLRPMHPLQGFPGPPWPYSVGQGCNNVAAVTPSQSSDNGIPNLAPWGAPWIFAAPALCVPTVPFPIMPPSFWACMSSWPNEALSVPWRGPNHGLSPSPSARTNNESSGNDSSTLGKHSRDGSCQSEEKIEKKTLWIPKTLRIDDPKEAAKSSIWSTLGIQPDESIKRGNMFRGFQSNNENSCYASNASQLLHANPAALSRSQTFQERT